VLTDNVIIDKMQVSLCDKEGFMTKDPLKSSEVSAGAEVLGSEGMTELVGSSRDVAGTEQPADERRHSLIFKTLTKSIYEQSLLPRHRFPVSENVPVKLPSHTVPNGDNRLFGSFAYNLEISLVKMHTPEIEIDRLSKTYPSVKEYTYDHTIARMVLNAGQKFADLLLGQGFDEVVAEAWRLDLIRVTLKDIFLDKSPLTVSPQHAISLIYGRWLEGLMAASLFLGIPIEVASEMTRSQEPNGDVSSVTEE